MKWTAHSKLDCLSALWSMHESHNDHYVLNLRNSYISKFQKNDILRRIFEPYQEMIGT